MSYYFSLETDKNWDAVEAALTVALKEQGFGILTTIDVMETLKKKIGAQILPYKIFGACNPGFAHKAITQEPDIGLMLPCNIVVRELENGNKKISVIDPPASMMAVQNEGLGGLAEEVQERLKKVLTKLKGEL